MNGARQSALLALGIAFVFMSACQKSFLTGPGPGHHYGQQDSRVFEVYIYADPNNPGKCLLDWPVGTLWLNKHQTVTWYSDDGSEYTIDFTQGTHAAPKSPFQNGTFTVQSGGKKSSGALQPGASGYYDFAIHAGDANAPICKDTSDPGYYVK
jgi:hypothetical protein